MARVFTRVGGGKEALMEFAVRKRKSAVSEKWAYQIYDMDRTQTDRTNRTHFYYFIQCNLRTRVR